MICDLAQFYNIHDYESLDKVRLSIYVNGLPEESRVKRKLSGLKFSLDTIIRAGILDRLSLLLYSFAGKKGSKSPESITDILLGKKNEEKKARAYMSGKEFEERRREILEKIEGDSHGD